MFGFSLIAALGTAFLAGPTLSGETESGIALSVLARPIRRSAFLLGQVAGAGRPSAAASSSSPGSPSASSSGRPSTTGHRSPVAALPLLAAQTIVLLTLAVLLSTAISPMASGVVAVGLFGATWIAGVVGGIGEALGNDGVGPGRGGVSRMLLPTDGLWRGAMHALPGPGRARRSSAPDVEGLPVPQRWRR